MFGNAMPGFIEEKKNNLSFKLKKFPTQVKPIRSLTTKRIRTIDLDVDKVSKITSIEWL